MKEGRRRMKAAMMKWEIRRMRKETALLTRSDSPT